MHVRILFLLALATVLVPSTTTAQEVGCSAVDLYIGQRREIRDEYRAAFIESLPGIPIEWEVSEDVWIDTLFSLSDEQLQTLSDLWGERAEALRGLDPSELAMAVHNADTLWAQRRSNIYRDMATMGVIATGLFYPDVATPAPGDVTPDDELAAACPAWAEYIAESAATPVPT